MGDYWPLSGIQSDEHFFSRVAALTVRLTDEKGVGEVCSMLAEAGRLFGAEAAAFATFVKDDEAFDSYRAVLACDPTWCLEYEARAGYMDDPWLEHSRHSSEARLTQQIPGRTSRQREVIELARRYGFVSGIVVPVHAPRGLTRLGALCIGSSRENHFDEQSLPAAAYAAIGLAARLHAWQVAQLRADLVANVHITPDDVVLLGFEREGRGSKEIAKILGTSSLSVDSRWQRLNAKLGVSSRSKAARLAAEYGVI